MASFPQRVKVSAELNVRMEQRKSKSVQLRHDCHSVIPIKFC